MKRLANVRDLIEALGGVDEVSSLLGLGTNAVHNWKTRGLPPETYVVLMRALESRGFTAPASLWKMREIAD
jgi:hypothetical protein